MSRRYNTSCEPCRKSRIGCDASLQKSGPCTNCVRRGKSCRSVGRRAASTTDHNVSHIADSEYRDYSDDCTLEPSIGAYQTTVDSPVSLRSTSVYNSEIESVTTRREQMIYLHHMLWDVFVSIWDSRAALWLSSSCNPFFETSVSDKSLLSHIALEADRSIAELTPGGMSGQQYFSTSSTSSMRASGRDRSLNDALRLAVYAYASRWLPFRAAFQKTQDVTEKKAQEMEQKVRDHFWRLARLSMPAAMAEPTYRSILALLLFTFTEMPVGDENFGFLHLCSEVLFSHIKYMKRPIAQHRAHSLSEYTSVLPVDETTVSQNHSSPQSVVDAGRKLDHLRDSMFWMGVITDSTRALVQQFPSVILPGRSGEGTVWSLIRQRNVIFDQSFRRLHASPLPLGQDVTEIVLQHALACKTMYFGVLNQFCDAAVHNHTESIDDAAQLVLEESRRFHDTLDQLLNLCARDYSALKTASRLTYTLVMSHYHLGTLILADVLDTLDKRPEQLSDPRLSRLFACSAVVNALSLALNSDRFSGEDSPYGSILLHDPTPITMVEVLSRTSRAIFALKEDGKIDTSTTQTMVSVVGAALSILSRVCTTASFVLTWLRQKCAQSQIRLRPTDRLDVDLDGGEHCELLGNCDREFLDAFLLEMKMVEATNGQSLLESTIAKYKPLEPVQPALPFIYSSDFLMGDGGWDVDI